MLARAAIQNSLTHLVTTTLALGRLDLAKTEAFPSESDAVRTLKADGRESNEERPAGSRYLVRDAAGRWESAEWVVGYLG